MPNPFERSRERSSRLHLIAFTELGGVATSARMQRRRSILQSSDTSRLFRTRRPANKGKKHVRSASIYSSARGGRCPFSAGGARITCHPGSYCYIGPFRISVVPHPPRH